MFPANQRGIQHRPICWAVADSDTKTFGLDRCAAT